MSDRRDLVFCHECENEFYKRGDSLTCPRCHSGFTELVRRISATVLPGVATHNVSTPRHVLPARHRRLYQPRARSELRGLEERDEVESWLYGRPLSIRAAGRSEGMSVQAQDMHALWRDDMLQPLPPDLHHEMASLRDQREQRRSASNPLMARRLV